MEIFQINFLYCSVNKIQQNSSETSSLFRRKVDMKHHAKKNISYVSVFAGMMHCSYQFYLIKTQLQLPISNFICFSLKYNFRDMSMQCFKIFMIAQLQ